MRDTFKKKMSKNEFKLKTLNVANGILSEKQALL